MYMLYGKFQVNATLLAPVEYYKNLSFYEPIDLIAMKALKITMQFVKHSPRATVALLFRLL